MAAHLGKLKVAADFCVLHPCVGQMKKKALEVHGGFTTGIPAGKLYTPFLFIITRELKQKRV